MGLYWAPRYWHPQYWNAGYFGGINNISLGAYWAPTYWYGRYWAPHYWLKPVGLTAGGYWAAGYFGPGYWTPTFWARGGLLGSYWPPGYFAARFWATHFWPFGRAGAFWRKDFWPPGYWASGFFALATPTVQIDRTADLNVTLDGFAASFAGTIRSYQQRGGTIAAALDDATAEFQGTIAQRVVFDLDVGFANTWVGEEYPGQQGTIDVELDDAALSASGTHLGPEAIAGSLTTVLDDCAPGLLGSHVAPPSRIALLAAQGADDSAELEGILLPAGTLLGTLSAALLGDRGDFEAISTKPVRTATVATMLDSVLPDVEGFSLQPGADLGAMDTLVDAEANLCGIVISPDTTPVSRRIRVPARRVIKVRAPK